MMKMKRSEAVEKRTLTENNCALLSPFFIPVVHVPHASLKQSETHRKFKFFYGCIKMYYGEITEKKMHCKQKWKNSMQAVNMSGVF